MKRIKKTDNNAKLLVFLMVLFILGVSNFTYADPPISPGQSTNTGNSAPIIQPGNSSNNGQTGTLQSPLKDNLNSVGALLNTGIMIFTYLVVLGAVIAFIIVGLKYIMARGNSTKITEATKWLWNIIIGVAIVIGARVIIQIVINTLKATKTVNTEVTQSAENALNGNKLNP